MAGDKKIKCEVIHPKLNMRVNGKLQRVPVGHPLELTEAQMEAFGPLKVQKVGKKPDLKIGEDDDKKSDDKKSDK